MLRSADFDARAPVQRLAQRIRRQPQFGRRQQRPFDVVAQLFEALADLLPRVFRGLQRTIADQRQRVCGKVVEQGFGAADGAALCGEEQRQVILHAGRRKPGLEVLHQRAAAGVDVEALAQRLQCALHVGIVHRHFAAGQQFDGFDLFQRTLRLRVEGTDAVDLVVQQLHPERRVGAHRIHVQQAAAHREVAGIEHLRHVAVAGRFQPALLRVHVHALAQPHAEAVAQHVAARRQPLHQGGGRHHHHASPEFWQPRQRGQPLADDFRVRAETVERQGFPVGEAQHRQRRIGAGEGAQVAFQLVCGVVVARHQQQRAINALRCGQRGGGQRGAGGGCAPVRALLAGAR